MSSYWNGADRWARRRIAETVAALDAQRVLEIGAHCGVNLFVLDRVRPFERLTGVDLSPSVVRRGRELLRDNAWSRCDLFLASTEALPFRDASFDLVLCSVVLVCIGPERIEAVLHEIMRVSRRYVVLCEPYDENTATASFAGRLDPYLNTSYWVRNYSLLLKRMGYALRAISVERMPLGENIGHLDSIAVLEKV